MNQRLGTPKAEFLESVRRSLGRRAGAPQPGYPRLSEELPALEEEAQRILARLSDNRAALLERLADVAQDRGWQVHRSADPEEAIAYIQALASSLGAERAVCSDQEVFRRLPLDMALQNLGLTVTTVAHSDGHSRESLRGEIAQAGLGITGADAAIAETGSVVLWAREGMSRLVSLVPPVHVALVRPEDVVESLDDLLLLRRLEYYRNSGDMGSYLNLITGPSRTADIEQTLVVGVHGPKQVHMLLLR